jgi:hypothetical protein
LEPAIGLARESGVTDSIAIRGDFALFTVQFYKLVLAKWKAIGTDLMIR